MATSAVEIERRDATAIEDRDVARAATAARALLEALPSRVDVAALERAIASGAPRSGPSALVRDAETADLAEALAPVIRRSFAEESRGIVVFEKDTATVRLLFNMTVPEAIAYAESNVGNLIVEIDESTRRAIRDLIARALRQGGAPRDLARTIRTMVGLHSRWAQAVMNYRFRLERQGLPTSSVERATARYYQKLLKARAMNIARTEVLRAQNAGRYQAWLNAESAGLLPKTAQKRWYAAASAEEVCAATDGQTVGLHDEFSNAFGSFEMPPAHPGCRCTAVIVADSVDVRSAQRQPRQPRPARPRRPARPKRDYGPNDWGDTTRRINATFRDEMAKLGKADMKVNFSTMPVETAKMAADELYRLFAKNPGLLRRVNEIVGRRLSFNTIADFNPSQGIMRLNLNRWTSLDDLARLLEDLGASRHCSTSDLRHALAHELGHALEGRELAVFVKEAIAVIRDRFPFQTTNWNPLRGFRGLPPGVREWLKDDLSLYGQSDWWEAISEMYAQWNYSSNPGVLARRIGPLMDDLFS